MEHDDDVQNESQEPTRLLLVDDQPDLLSALSEILTDHGFAVVSTWDGEEAVEIASVFEPNVLVTDFQLPGIDGLTTIRLVREDCPEIRSILVSGSMSTQTRRRAAHARVDELFDKPVSVPSLLRAITEDSD